MRKIIVYNVISLDGYHTGVGNDVSVMFPMMGNVFDAYNTELLRAADVQLMGRVSFELFQSFWPKVAADPTSDAWTDAQRDLAQAGSSPSRALSSPIRCTGIGRISASSNGATPISRSPNSDVRRAKIF
jgi:hypothetical protein